MSITKSPSPESIRERLSNRRNKLARFYDAGPREFDRFTIVYLQEDCIDEQGIRWYSYRAASENPFAPCGLGITGQSDMVPLDGAKIARLGRRNHLGRRVNFSDLPSDVQTLVVRDLMPCP